MEFDIFPSVFFQPFAYLYVRQTFAVFEALEFDYLAHIRMEYRRRSHRNSIAAALQAVNSAPTEIAPADYQASASGLR